VSHCRTYLTLTILGNHEQMEVFDFCRVNQQIAHHFMNRGMLRECSIFATRVFPSYSGSALNEPLSNPFLPP
jgi:hypothetical protein